MDILDEKDLDGMSYEELLQIHIGVHHPLEDSDDSEEDNFYEKAPIFDLQQIKATAINAKDLHSGEKSPVKSVEGCLVPKNADILQIAKNLSKLMSPSYCSVCLKHAAKRNMHYQSKNHFTNIILWIESRTKTKDPNVTKKIFCFPCNLSLVHENEEHYSTKKHLKNEKTFCTICFQIVTQSMTDHIYYHQMNNAQSEDIKSITGNYLSCNREVVIKELKAKFTPTICHLCKVHLRTSLKHYKTKRHLQSMRTWIEENSYRIGMNTTNDQNSFFCEACSELFVYANLAKQHFKTIVHLKNLSTFCSGCSRYLETRQALRDHYREKHNIDISEPKATGQNLEELTKLNMCQLCNIVFNESTAAQKHYQTSSIHAMRVFDFLELNNAAFRGNSIGDLSFCLENGTSSKFNNDSTEALKDNSSNECKPTPKTPGVCSTETFEDNTISESEHSRSEPDVRSTEKFQYDNKKSEYSHTEPDLHVTRESEANDNNKFEHLDSILKEQIVHEIALVMDKTYYSRSISLEVVLEGLKTLNRQVAGIIENNKILRRIEESSKTPNINSFKVNHQLTEVLDKYKFSSSSKTKSPIDSANKDYTKLKLAIEVTRMKATLETFSVELALRFAYRLRTLIMNIEKNKFDIESIFSLPEAVTVHIPSVALNLLKIELEVLERRLLKSKRISMELALEIVTQFNVRLEMEAETMKNEIKPFVDEHNDFFRNIEENVACAIPTLKTLSDDSVNAKESHKDEPIDINQDSAKLQLRKEITKMKIILSKNWPFLIADALKYVRGLKALIKKIEEHGNMLDKVDIGVVFLSTEAEIENTAGDLVLQRELAGLEWRLTVGRRKFGVELALDIVKQFSAGLEKLKEVQKGNNDEENSKHDDFSNNDEIVLK
ncbi:uncharacterized protein [Euwallacea fornicatus]|uniref:uncharacterized protein n=1 Tax=Euwallacea fornicatus TaxID=995702 RepID=UPI00338DF847